MSEVKFSECESATDDRPIRQGDVIESLTPNSDPQFGVIVTADCDIAQSKHNNTLSYVPLLTLGRFLVSHYIPRRLTKALEFAIKELTLRATQFRQDKEPGAAGFSESAMEAWLRADDGDTVSNVLEIKPGTKRDGFTSLANAYRAGQSLSEAATLRQCVEALCGIRAHQGGSSEKAAIKIREEIKTYINGLPGDAFFVGSIGTEPSQRTGHVAYLRILKELRPSDVAIRTSELARAKAKRIARLRSPFVYRLTQQLASVFSSIGLPTVYEDERDRIADDISGLGVLL